VLISNNVEWETPHWWYFYRFGITDRPMCQCEGAEDQTTDHLLFRCKELRHLRTGLIKKNIKKTARGDRPMTNEKLINDYLQVFINFVKSIDFTVL
jgi:hypothetical protein